MKTEAARNLSYATLSDIEQGVVARMLDNAIRRCLEDVHDRPTPETRKIRLEIALTPQVDKKTFHFNNDVQVNITVDDTLPKRGGRYVTGRLRCAASGSPELFFSPESPDNPDQITIADIGAYDEGGSGA